MSTKLYDPNSVVVTWGPYLLQGFMDGTWLEVTRDEDAFMKKIGADGEAARARNKNRGGSVTLTLLQTSSSNDSLSAEQIADELAGTGSHPLMVKDLFGTTLITAPNAWVKKPADVVFAKEIQGRAWTLDCDLLLGQRGGAAFGP